MTSREPDALQRGKAFHRLVQQEWLEETRDGKPVPEKNIRRQSGRTGRMDIIVEELGDFVAVIEIKNTDWDRIAERNILRNLRRHARQIWSYIEAELDLYGNEVCPGIIYPAPPMDSRHRQSIESFLNEEGIQVVWHSELKPLPDKKERENEPA